MAFAPLEPMDLVRVARADGGDVSLDRFDHSLAKPSRRMHLDGKWAARIAAERHDQAVYRQVDARDRFRCRCCGRKLLRTFTALPARLDRHHIIAKAQRGPTETWNLCHLALVCHTARHVTGALTVTGNADDVLTFTRDGRTWTSEWRHGQLVLVTIARVDTSVDAIPPEGVIP